MRIGGFEKQLGAWVDLPCALTMHVRWGTSPLTVTGILRATADGWALVPPEEFGGVRCFQITLLELDSKPMRKIVEHDTADGARLRYWSHPDVIFELELVREQSEGLALPA